MANIDKDLCYVCQKAVYAQDRLVADARIYHKPCFRCKKCSNVLKLGNFASMDGEVFCKVCFKKNFFTKGNYSEGFGKLKPQEQHDLKTGKQAVPALGLAFKGVADVQRTSSATKIQKSENRMSLPVTSQDDSAIDELRKQRQIEEVVVVEESLSAPTSPASTTPEEDAAREARKKELLRLEEQRKKQQEEDNKQRQEKKRLEEERLREHKRNELAKIEEQRKTKVSTEQDIKDEEARKKEEQDKKELRKKELADVEENRKLDEDKKNEKLKRKD